MSTNGTTAVATVEQSPMPAPTKPSSPGQAMGLEPRDMRQLWVLCQHLVGTGFLPKAIQAPGQAMAIVLAGKDLGLSAMQSLRGLTIVEGKVGLSADLMLGLMIKGGVRHEWLESNERVATLKVERPGHRPLTYSFTFAMAQRANLVKPGGAWTKYPEAMLRARVISAVTRSYAPDLGYGLYLPEELASDRIPPTDQSEGGIFLEAQPVVSAAPPCERVDPETGEVVETKPSAPEEKPKAKRKTKGDSFLDAAGVSAPAEEVSEGKRLEFDPAPATPSVASEMGLPGPKSEPPSPLDQALAWIREAPNSGALTTLRKALHELNLSEADAMTAGEAYRAREADLRRVGG